MGEHEVEQHVGQRSSNTLVLPIFMACVGGYLLYLQTILGKR